jgi:vancomycin resistance protein YoaR
LVNGKAVVAQPERPGIELDRAGSFALLKTIGTKPDRRIDLPVKVTLPAVTAAQAANLTFPDLLAEASTSYRGGIAERNHNVELAAARVDGIVIQPGATFSFNDAVGRTRIMDGYQMAFGIVSGADGVQTVPSVAGGICQVATTLFHAAFWAGLPIVERHEHPYWIPKYGLPPRGLTGLDTTVDEESGLDFQFKNTTGAPLLVHATTDGGKVAFILEGVKPGWTVQAGQAVVSNLVKTDPTFQRQEDSTLEAGRAIQVEEARDGFDALVVRQVAKAGTLIDRLEVKSHYAPSHNVILVGTKKPGA